MYCSWDLSNLLTLLVKKMVQSRFARIWHLQFSKEQQQLRSKPAPCQDQQSVSSSLEHLLNTLSFFFLNFIYKLATAGSDYVERTVALTFTPTSSPRQCVDVSILDNLIFEGEESFSAQLVPDDETTVIMAPSNVAVTITDEDCTHNFTIIILHYSDHAYIFLPQLSWLLSRSQSIQ